MRFQPGQSGNPAGRPPGSLNKKTLAANALLEEHAEEIARNLMDRAKNGEPTAMRLCMDRLAPTGRNRRVAIQLPMVRTPEDAEAALAVVMAEFADGKLTIGEFSDLLTAVDRAVRVAERIWNFARARRYAAQRDAILLGAEEQDAKGGAEPARTVEKPAAPLYSPVNAGVAVGARTTDKPVGGEAEASRAAPKDTPSPLARAA
jgi:hypothetical protein